MAAITDQIKASGDKHMHVSHIKLLQLRMHVINILLLTKRKRMACRQRSTIFKKWDLQVKFPAIYKVHTYVTAFIHTCDM